VLQVQEPQPDDSVCWWTGQSDVSVFGSLRHQQS